MTMQENVLLAPLTTLQVGGPARFFVEARNEDEVRQAVEYAGERSLPLFVLGGGSNLVVSDAGWPGLVLKVAIRGMTVPDLQNASSGTVLFSAGAGMEWDALVGAAVARNCAGVECLSGIPGSVGGTPVQNVGAYGQEVSDTIESVRAFDRKDSRVVVLPKPACGFGYRTSIFNTRERGRYVIVSVNFRLKRGGAPSLKYADLQKHFAGRPTPSLAEVREAVREIRRSKGMLIVPGEDDYRSAGSFFKNPVLKEADYQELGRRAAAKGLAIPSYPALDAQHKVSAAWLVEHSGFAKGHVAGAAGISSKHALALVNRGAATAADMVALQSAIQQRVETEWGVRLETEPVFVGF